MTLKFHENFKQFKMKTDFPMYEFDFILVYIELEYPYLSRPLKIRFFLSLIKDKCEDGLRISDQL